MKITKSQLRRYYNSLRRRKSYALAWCLVLLCLLLGITFVAFAGSIDYNLPSDNLHNTSHIRIQGKEYNIKKYVLEKGCNNPMPNFLVTLYRHESQGSQGVEEASGYTNQHGYIDFGDWPENHWYSIEISYEQWGYSHHDEPFYLTSDKVIYNYVVVPPNSIRV